MRHLANVRTARISSGYIAPYHLPWCIEFASSDQSVSGAYGYADLERSLELWAQTQDLARSPAVAGGAPSGLRGGVAAIDEPSCTGDVTRGV
jgi:hypothetical protein